MTQPQTIKLGAAYIRVSTGKQEELSPDSQKRLILDYAKSNNIIIPEEFIFMENGISGRKADKRPQFQRMIALAKAGEFQAILLWKFSRFARNQEESIVYKSMLRKNGVEVISISEPLVDGPFGGLIERIIEWMDEFYSIRLSGDVTRGMTEKAMRGGYQCRPPLGYRIPYHNAVPEIVPEEAETIRMIFDKFVNEKMGIYALTKYLNSLGLKTSHGKPFEKRSLEYILQNPAYAGIIRWNRTTNETNEIKDRSEWIIRQGHHPAIISEDLYNQAMARFESEHTKRNAKPAEITKHWLSGLLKCSACGRTLSSCVRHRKSGTAHYPFQCYGYLKGKCSHNSYVTEQMIAPAVLDALNDVLSLGTVHYEVKGVEKKEDLQKLNMLKASLSKLELKERRAKEAYMDGIDTLEDYKQNKALIQEERASLEAAIRDACPPEKDTSSQDARMLQNIHNVVDIIQSSHFTMVQKNTALKSIVDRIVFDKDTMHITIYYYLAASPSSITTKKVPET